MNAGASPPPGGEPPPPGGQRESPPPGGQRESPPPGGQRESPPPGSQRESLPAGGQREPLSTGSQAAPTYPLGEPAHLPTPSSELQLYSQHGAPTPAPLRALAPFHAVDGVLGRLELALLILLVAAMMLLGTVQVIMREVFNTGLPWADPLLRNMVLWAGMLGAMVATQAGRHLNMDAFARLLPAGLRRWIDVLVNLAAAVTCAVLVWVSIPYLEDEIDAGADAIAFGLLPWHVQLIFPISFAVMAFRFLLFCVDGILGGRPQSHQIPVTELAGDEAAR